MKKFILLSTLCVSLYGYGQDAPTELNCYNKWAAKFEERGAEEVKDGVYDDVIITFRQGAKATCNNGRAEVVKGMVVKVYILLNDGTYEEVKRAWKNNSDKDVTVTNGISKPMLTVYSELVNVLWPKKIKAKKAKAVSAPDPTDD